MKKVSTQKARSGEGAGLVDYFWFAVDVFDPALVFFSLLAVAGVVLLIFSKNPYFKLLGGLFLGVVAALAWLIYMVFQDGGNWNWTF